jgi:DNA repair protein RecO (recombination protein O)
MQTKTKGIVLKTIKYSDRKLIVKIYTDTHGLQSFFVSLGSSSKAKIKPALLQPLTQIEIETSVRPNKQFASIKDIHCNYQYADLTQNIYKNTIALFLNEVMYACLKEEEPNQNMFEFVTVAFQWLDQSHEHISNFHLYFLIELSKHLGFYPQNNYTTKEPYFDLREGAFIEKLPHHPDYLLPETGILLSNLLMVDLRNIRYYQLTKPERDELMSGLLYFFRLHISGINDIKSLQVLKETLS